MPLLLVRRHAQVLLSNADVELKQCLGQHDLDSVTTSMKPKANSDMVDARKYECLTSYKKNLKASIPQISSIYSGYIKNFGTDGKLIQPQLSSESNEVVAQVQKQMDVIGKKSDIV